MIYLDYAAATPLLPEVLQTMEPFFADQFYNPSANYLAAQAVRRSLDTARSDVAELLGTRSSEIVFTAGGTESDNLAIQGVMQSYPDGNVIVSTVEHDAILLPAAEYNCKIATVTSEGIVSPDAVAALIDERTVLVSVMYANNEVGTVQPIRRIAQMIAALRDERRKAGNNCPIYLHTDACQAANYLDLHVSRLGVDMMTLNGGKIYGPKQSGILYVSSKVTLQPLLRGGGQERGLRSGTENVAACVGFAKALQLAQAARHDESLRLAELQAYAYAWLAEQLPHAIVNGSRKHRLPNNIHITLPGHDNERMLVELDLLGILAAAGSACSASNEDPSHVLRAMAISDENAQSSLRLTMGLSTTKADITTALEALKNILS